MISPTDAEGMFDVLTYEKGASVIRQLEQYLGEIPFRDGVRHYLTKHRFGNTETTDLFDALEHVTGQPVRTLMDSWIFQGGYPIVNVALDSATNTATFTQRPFTYLPTSDTVANAKTWSVPFLYRTEGAGGTVEHKILLDVESKSASVPAGTTLVVGNSGGHGFYRVSYDASLQSAVRASFASLPAIERFIVVSDLWASVLQGSATAEHFLELTDTLGAERDLSVWRAVTAGWGSLEMVFDDTRRATLADRVRAVLRPMATELGWNETPGETGLTGQLRGLIITTLGKVGDDPQIIAGAAERIGAVLTETSTLPADVGAAVITVASSHADDAQWPQFDAARLAATSPQATVRLLRALSMFPSKELAKQTLELMVGPTVRTQDAPYAIGVMATSRVAGPVAWSFLKSNWAKLNQVFPNNSIPGMISPFSAQSSPEIAADIRAFFAPGTGHEVPQAKKQLEQMLERLEINVNLRSREMTAAVPPSA